MSLLAIIMIIMLCHIIVYTIHTVTYYMIREYRLLITIDVSILLRLMFIINMMIMNNTNNSSYYCYVSVSSHNTTNNTV